MTRILSDSVQRPTKVYETETGYVVTSRLKYRQLTLGQKAALAIIGAGLAVVIFGDGGGQDLVALIGGAAFLLLIINMIFVYLPLRLKVRINTTKNRVYITKGFLQRHRAPFDEGSVFVYNNEDEIEYRHGMQSSVFAFGLKLPESRDGKWDNARATSVAAALNATIRLALSAPQAARKKETSSVEPEPFNPME